MSDTIAEAETKTGATPEQKAERQNARRLGKVVLAQAHLAAHPEASGAEIREAVAAQKAMQVKAGKQMLRAMQKAGFTVTFAEPTKG